MAIEEEFSVEIPDKEADEIKTVGQAVDYIAQHPEGNISPETQYIRLSDSPMSSETCMSSVLCQYQAFNPCEALF